MLQCSWLLLLHSLLAAASLRGHEENEGRDSDSAPWLSFPAGVLHGVWRCCFEALHEHARGLGTEWKNFFLVPAAVGAFAPDLSHDGRRRVAVTSFLGKYVATLSLECCFGGNVLAAVRFPDGGNCVSAAVKSRTGCLAAEGIAHPSQRRPVGHPLSVCLQHRNRRHQYAARQRMPPLTRVRPEGDTSAVALRGGTPCGTVACPKPPRGVCTRQRALNVGCLRHEGHCGGVPPPCRWTDV
ncbi:hypothetical protein TcBrA4_0052860 [Trypanosoma cruzi]|nr:hypothetical protein TcBrA4_0052860 [Trypanosoma cruzi]